MQAPIVKIIVRDGQIVEATFYTPALPDGEHDLYCDPGDERIADLEREVELQDKELDLIPEMRERIAELIAGLVEAGYICECNDATECLLHRSL